MVEFFHLFKMQKNLHLNIFQRKNYALFNFVDRRKYLYKSIGIFSLYFQLSFISRQHKIVKK